MTFRFGFTIEQCRQIKQKIDEDMDYPFKYFITITWCPRRLAEMRIDLVKRHPDLTDAEIDIEMLNWRKNQVYRYFIKIAKECKSHLNPYWSLAPECEHEHAHAILLSEKKILRKYPRILWEHGKQIDVKEYDPDYGERNHNDWKRNAVNYTLAKHIPIPNERGPICPGKRRSCKSGDCIYKRREFYK